MDNLHSKQMYQQRTPIEIIGLCSDIGTNKSRNNPLKPRPVLTLGATRQNRIAGTS